MSGLAVGDVCVVTGDEGDTGHDFSVDELVRLKTPAVVYRGEAWTCEAMYGQHRVYYVGVQDLRKVETGRVESSEQENAPIDTRISYRTAFDDVAKATYMETLELLLKKHADYGPLNIMRSPGGPLNGLRVRMWDKLARINNLIEKGVEPENESLEDSFKDLMNYAGIGLMVIRDQFPNE